MKKFLWRLLVTEKENIHVGYRRLPYYDKVVLHGHDFPEMFWIESGRGCHIVNGKRQSLERNDLLFVRPDDVHAMTAAPPGHLDFTNIAVSPENFKFICERYLDGNGEFWGGKNNIPEKIKLSELQVKMLKASAFAIAEKKFSKFATDRFLLNLINELVFVPLNRQYETCPDWLNNALEKMKKPEHFQKGTGELSRISGRTREYIARIMKKNTGLCPMEIVNDYRLEYAAQQLRLGKMEIIDISLNCGFSSLSHFYKIFRRKFHVTPRQYRIQHQETLPGKNW